MRGIATRWFWLAWVTSAAVLAAWFYWKLDSSDRSVFVPGRTSDGHYQIELACDACHSQRFAGAEAMQAACETCHLDALDEARDSHPQSKFTDPRNADRVAQLDARYCVTCHVEHKPERTLAMGLTISEDYCVLCHQDIGVERPSHAGMQFATCASAGCHNFHDNRALYEDFLLRHAGEPAVADDPRLEMRNFAEIAPLLAEYPKDRYPITALTIADADGPPATDAPRHTASQQHWAGSAHAQAGVNCTACHVEQAGSTWIAQPGFDSCALCHTQESAGFTNGKHGMRLAAKLLGRELPAMRVADARLPMNVQAHDRELNCASCHDAHSADTQNAVVSACLQCHSDEHSVAYEDSPHARLWQQELSGDLPEGSAVTCASCHMPRVQNSYEWGAYVHNLVEHNQSATLRPNEKMLRPVCLECHGYEFSVNALADSALIKNNFSTSPDVAISSTAMAVERRAQINEEREAARQ